MSTDEKPYPSVPPTDEIVHPEKRRGTRTLDRERSGECDCGGTIYTKKIATGRIIVAMWDSELFDSDEYDLSTQYGETERRVECDRCGAGWSY